MITFVQILIGVALLVMGRKLFWLFVGSVGFVAGLTLATWLFQDHSALLLLLIALGIGLFGAVLAIVLQKAAVGLGGFLAGGYLLLHLNEQVQLVTGGFPWMLFVIGGISGTVCLLFIFEWALIVLSSLAGAVFVVDALYADTESHLLMIGVMSTIGVLVQARGLQKKKPAGKEA